MGQMPQSTHASEQPVYYFPEGLEMGSEQELNLQATYPWMMATMIEDDDLQFGGKPLSTWYEEDRRRYSLGEDSAPSTGFAEEEERRGRQRVGISHGSASQQTVAANTASQDRPHYHKPSHHTHHHKKSAKSDKKQ